MAVRCYVVGVPRLGRVFRVADSGPPMKEIGETTCGANTCAGTMPLLALQLCPRKARRL